MSFIFISLVAIQLSIINFIDYNYIEMEGYRHANSVFKTEDNHTIWIGDIQAAESIRWLRQKNIKTVFTVASGFTLKYDSSIKHFCYNLKDLKSQNISQYFDIAAYQLQKSLKLGSLLVHCGAGVSRSPSVVIAYLIRYHKMSFHQALRLLKSQRPQICPNLGFELQLKAYQNRKNKSKYKSAFQLYDSKPKIKNLPTLSHSNQSMIIAGIYHRPHIKSVYKPKHHQQLPKNKSMLDRGTQFQMLKKLAEFRYGASNMRRTFSKGMHV